MTQPKTVPAGTVPGANVAGSAVLPAVTTSLAEAERIAAAVRALPSVAEVHSGPLGQIATIQFRRRVGGVRVTEHDVTVGVTVEVPFAAGAVAAAVRAAVHRSGAPARRVHVLIADIACPADSV